MRYGEASGVKGAEQMQADPLVAWSGFTTQLGNLAANLAEPAVKAAGPALDGIAAGLGNLSGAVAQFNKDHPTFAPIAEAGAGAAAVAGAGVASWYAARGTIGMFGRMLGLGGQGAAGAAGAAEAGAVGEAAGIAGAAGGEAGAAAGSIGAAGAALPIMAGLAAMGGGIYLLSHSGGKTTASGRAEPMSQKDTDQPGHKEIARGGAPIWVADPPKPSPRKPAGPFPVGQDFTLGSLDRGFERDAPEEDGPAIPGSMTRRRVRHVTDAYPAMPEVPAAVAPLPVAPLAVAPAPLPVMAAAGPPQSVDVAVTMGDPKFDGQLRVTAEPSQWLIAKIDNLAQTFSMGGTSAAVSKPSTGASMPNAGLPAHPGRMGPN